MDSFEWFCPLRSKINGGMPKNLFICIMRCIPLLSCTLIGLFITIGVKAQGRKIDTTAFFGDAGYRVTCNNKKEDLNGVTITPKGFKNTARDASFDVKGRLVKILVDDFNDDGFPDLLLCLYSGPSFVNGNIIGIYSSENTTLMPASFPDLYNDPKLREGYKGHDEFTVVVGSLLRSFPIYKPTDVDTATGGTRVIQYKIMADAEKRMVFKVLRSYEK